MTISSDRNHGRTGFLVTQDTLDVTGAQSRLNIEHWPTNDDFRFKLVAVPIFSLETIIVVLYYLAKQDDM